MIKKLTYTRNYNLFNKLYNDDLTEKNELNLYLKALYNIKNCINDKKRGSAIERGFYGFQAVLDLMGVPYHALNMENVIDAELYHDVGRKPETYKENVTGCCYVGELIEWLGNFPDPAGGYDVKTLKNHVATFDKMLKLKRESGDLGAAVCVDTLNNIHRVTVPDINKVVNILIKDIKRGLHDRYFLARMNVNFGFIGHRVFL